MTPWNDIATSSSDLSEQLKTLTKALPERFHAKLNDVLDQLPLLLPQTTHRC